ncbi:hypothetical protein GCM10023200_19690 [Actinomycetospora chlora]|uniref:Uncharacterized protein n=1 Tax=Actinomycetospora chlora TaxID=663608 RepID=A0ABP9AX36_9PSEU
MVPALKAAADGVVFGVICSDVIYPASSIGDYPDKFFWPYRHLSPSRYGPRPATTTGTTACAASSSSSATCSPNPAPGVVPAGGCGAGWRRGYGARDAPSERAELDAMREVLPVPTHAARTPQPAPYFAIDTRQVRYMCIDTGIGGRIDPSSTVGCSACPLRTPSPGHRQADLRQR